MTPQMDAGQPIREVPGAGYGAYEGNQSYAPPPQYNPGPQSSAYDDEYVDSLAQRLSQRMAQGPQGKIQAAPRGGDRVSAGMRLALAIVSISVLVPLAAILMGGVGGIAGLISFGAACVAIFLINAVFSNYH
jgi:hypothetical protein